MKLDYLFSIGGLLIAISLMSGCGLSASDNPDNVFNGAVFISDNTGKNELFIADSEALGVVKISDDIMMGGVTSFLVSPNIGFIAYLADQDIDTVNELYFLKNGETTPVKINSDLISSPQEVKKYAWSPNGRFMAYIADQDTPGTFELFVSDAKTTTKVSSAIAPGDEVFDFKWSPDSKNIAYTAPALGVGELFVSKGDVFDAGAFVVGVQVSSSTIGVTPIDEYEWSPNGSLIAYLTDEDFSGDIDLYTTDVDTITSINVTDADSDVLSFKWSNGSGNLAYLANLMVADTGVNLFVTDSTSINVKTLSSVVIGEAVTSYLWAPNDSLLGYIADEETTGISELFIALPDGALVATKASASPDTVDSFIWSLISNKLIYRAEQGTDGIFQLYTSTVDDDDTTKSVQISGDLVTGGSVSSDFKISPFGSAVSYIADQENDGVFELYVTGFDKDNTIRLSANLIVPRNVSEHDWSSDGTKVFYVANQDADMITDVYSNSLSATDSLNLSNSLSATGIIQGAFVDGSGVTENLFP